MFFAKFYYLEVIFSDSDKLINCLASLAEMLQELFVGHAEVLGDCAGFANN